MTQPITHGFDIMNPHNSLSHFEFTELNNMVLKNGGTVAAPRSKRNVRYVAPRDLPNSTFGELTTGEGLFLGASAPFIIGGTALFYAGAGMFSAWSQEFFIGNKRNLAWKTIAKRNGILGAVFGGIAVAALTASLAAPKDAQ